MWSALAFAGVSYWPLGPVSSVIYRCLVVGRFRWLVDILGHEATGMKLRLAILCKDLVLLACGVALSSIA